MSVKPCVIPAVYGGVYAGVGGVRGGAGDFYFDPADFGTVEIDFDSLTLAKANGATMTTWPDLSGNARHLAAETGAMTYMAVGTGTGRPAVNMPVDTRMQTPVFQQFPSLAGTFLALYTPKTLPANEMICGSFDSTDPDWALLQGTVIKGSMGGTNWNARTNQDIVNRPACQALLRNGASVTTFDRSARTTITLGANSQQSTARFYLGNPSTGAAAEITRLIQFREALTPDAVRDVMALMIRRHLGKFPVTVVCCGDSITAGHTVGATPYPLQMEPIIGHHCFVENLGVSSALIANITASQIPTANIWSGRAYQSRSVLVSFCGTNDIFLGASGATAYANYAASVATSTASEKIAVTMLKRTDFDAAKEAQRVIFNNLMVADSASYSQVARPDLVPELSDPTVTAIYPDGTHLSTLGYGYLATCVGDRVNALGY